MCPFSPSSSPSRARFFAAAALGTALLAATLTAADFEDLGTVVYCFIVLLVDFDSALLCGGVVREDDIFPSGTIRLDINPGGSLCNDVRKFFLPSHGNTRKIMKQCIAYLCQHCELPLYFLSLLSYFRQQSWPSWPTPALKGPSISWIALRLDLGQVPC